MKLIIQIPCFNEEKTLPLTYVDLPKEIDGIDVIETLIINDGSTDKTVEVAEALGVNHIVNFKRNKGLARAFDAGLEACLKAGADIIVNTDADNQYFGGDIEKLVKPIVEGKADVVIGDRQTNKIEHFSPVKKMLQKLGSYTVRKLSQTEIRDAVSGFRAFNRDTAEKINILTDFSYTIENIIQLEYIKAKIISVPIKTNPITRKSRLFKSIPNFIGQQLTTLIRAYSNYRALKVFTTLGMVLILPGILGFIRFLYFYFSTGGKGHVQSLIFSTAILNVGFLVIIFGILADMISKNRKIIEKILEINKKQLWKKK